MGKVRPDGVFPILQDGLTILPTFDFDVETMSLDLSGADVFYGGTKVFSVNEMGRRLLGMADGTRTVDEMVKILKMEKNASEAGMFFVTLGQSGYLKNKVEVVIYETEGSICNDA